MLMYVRADDPSGTAWGTPVVVDASTPGIGLFPSMVVIDGRPAISYFDDENGQLRYVRAANSSGTAWGAPAVVDATAGAGIYPSMAIVNGHPAISYYYDNFPSGEVRYVRAESTDGSTWGTPVTLASFSFSLLPLIGYDASFPLAVIGGRPAVSFMDWDADVDTYQLHFIRASDANGAAWGTAVVADTAEAAGTYSALMEVGNRPAIAYYEADNAILKYVEAISMDGSSWGLPRILDDSADVGDYCSMIFFNGHPAVSYCDWDNGDLKYFGYPPSLLQLILPAISSKGRELENDN
jgi:hypothetical protein